MSKLQRFRVWVKASRQRGALVFASWLAVWMATTRFAVHHDRHVLSNLVEFFVIAYLLHLLITAPSRSKRPS